jgi:hypothetical protein
LITHRRSRNSVRHSRSGAWRRLVAAGAGPIPDRTTICTTLAAGSTAQINTAIANCPANQTVKLSAGTYTVGSPGIIFNDKSNVTRGAARTPRSSISTAATTAAAWVAMFASSTARPTDRRTRQHGYWSAGYTPGSTQVTLSSTTNLKVGTVTPDQLNDTNTDNGGVWVCGTGGINVRLGGPVRHRTRGSSAAAAGACHRDQWQ